MSDADRQVLASAAALVAAFGSNDVNTYFACFADDATFLFHTEAGLLESADAYRQAWAAWVRDDGFRVLSCESSQQRVQMLGSVAIFTHRVHTRIATNAGEEEMYERETIAFRQLTEGRWIAVHEHLSPAPLDTPGQS